MAGKKPERNELKSFVLLQKKGKKKAQRATSNVFAMFEQSQVQEFKEAFGLMDQDRDGTISADDLKEVFNSLGKVPKDAEIKAMIDEAPGPINFTMLLTLYGDRLNGNSTYLFACPLMYPPTVLSLSTYCPLIVHSMSTQYTSTAHLA